MGRMRWAVGRDPLMWAGEQGVWAGGHVVWAGEHAVGEGTASQQRQFALKSVWMDATKGRAGQNRAPNTKACVVLTLLVIPIRPMFSLGRLAVLSRFGGKMSLRTFSNCRQSHPHALPVADLLSQL